MQSMEKKSDSSHIRVEVSGPTDQEVEEPDTISLPSHSRSGRKVTQVQRYSPIEDVEDDDS